MARTISFETGEYYHIYNRGVDKRIIFESNTDRFRFQKLLYLCNTSNSVWLSGINLLSEPPDIFLTDRAAPLVHIGAYCILGNHFHLLLKSHREQGVSQFMQKLCTAYSMYFNRKHQRTGSLFEGPFRAKHVTNDEHLKYLFSYIHLNPVEHIEPHWKDKGIQNISRVKQYLKTYKYSSLPEYVDNKKRSEANILDQSKFPRYFTNHKDCIDEMNHWLRYELSGALPY